MRAGHRARDSVALNLPVAADSRSADGRIHAVPASSGR
jgi:hypothetical protein